MNARRDWIERGARFGHLTKGVLYGLIGALALQVAFGAGGEVAGGEEAARFVERQPFGRVLLGLIGAGLGAYALWRFVEAAKGGPPSSEKAKQLARRAGAFAGGIVNLGLAVMAFQLALGQPRGGAGAQSWVGKLLEQPFGSWLVGLAGAGIIAAGLVQLHRAYSKKFLDEFRWQSMSQDERRWITRMGQVGYSARGVVFPIIGAGLLRAALARDPSETRDTREALLDIATSSHGQILLGFVAAGFLAFGFFMVASARYRQIAA